jgi:hypothetical protein
MQIASKVVGLINTAVRMIFRRCFRWEGMVFDRRSLGERGAWREINF